MNNRHVVAHAILWAAAIATSALLGAPRFLCLVLLPMLAVQSLRVSGQRACILGSDRS